MQKLICLIFGLVIGSSLAFAEEQATAEGYKESIAESKNETPIDPKTKPDPDAQVPPKNKIPRNLLKLSDGEYYSQYAFVADKAKRTLTIWKETNDSYDFVAAHPMDMGKKEGDKRFLGDLKTPEGVYFFNKTYRENELDYNEYGVRAFVMDYPNYFDRMEKKTGYGIWLHAIPPSKTLYRGSRGCLVLRNEAIVSVEPYVDLTKTPIIVEDEVIYDSKQNIAKEQNQINDWLKSWKAAWESKSIDSYMDFYHDNFRWKKMNKAKWKTYKSSLNEKYDYINVKLFEPTAYQQKDEYVIRFLQKYQSDGLDDFGEKTLFVKRDQGKFLIVGEEWAPLPQELIARYSQQTTDK